MGASSSKQLNSTAVFGQNTYNNILKQHVLNFLYMDKSKGGLLYEFITKNVDFIIIFFDTDIYVVKNNDASDVVPEQYIDFSSGGEIKILENQYTLNKNGDAWTRKENKTS